jgi:hypothetical protein
MGANAMKTISVYQFNELSAKAQETAIENYRNKHYDQEVFWASEMVDSLKGLFKVCDGIKLKDYSLGDQRSSIDVEFSQDEAGNLSGKRAFAWIENNLLSNIRIPFYGDKRKELRKYGRSYYAGNIKPCPFTGYCFDENLLESLLNDIKDGTDLKTAFEGLAQVYEKQFNAEQDYQNSDEYIKEQLTDNDYDFTLEGHRI